MIKNIKSESITSLLNHTITQTFLQFGICHPKYISRKAFSEREQTFSEEPIQYNEKL